MSIITLMKVFYFRILTKITTWGLSSAACNYGVCVKRIQFRKRVLSVHHSYSLGLLQTSVKCECDFTVPPAEFSTSHTTEIPLNVVALPKRIGVSTCSYLHWAGEWFKPGEDRSSGLLQVFINGNKRGGASGGLLDYIWSWANNYHDQVSQEHYPDLPTVKNSRQNCTWFTPALVIFATFNRLQQLAEYSLWCDSRPGSSHRESLTLRVHPQTAVEGGKRKYVSCLQDLVK